MASSETTLAGKRKGKSKKSWKNQKKIKDMELQILIAAKTIAAEFVQWVWVDQV